MLNNIKYIDAVNIDVIDDLVEDSSKQYSIDDCVLIRTTDVFPFDGVVETPINGNAYEFSKSMYFGEIIIDMLKNKYPERELRIVDSLGASGGYGLLVAMASDLKDNGASYEELHTWLEDNKLNIHHWFFSTDLTSYYRGGRISKTSQVFGTMLNICPLLNMDYIGRLIPRSKYRGKKKITAEIVERMISHAKNGTDYNGKCFITHSACPEEAGMVADLVNKNFPNLESEIHINSIGTVIGSHTGPGTVALFFYGDKRED